MGRKTTASDSMTGRVLYGALLTLWWGAGGVADEGGVDEQIDAAFGADLARVAATPEPHDDVELAGRMVDVAAAPQTEPEQAAALCDHAYRLSGGHAAGRDTAVRAMRVRMERSPGDRDACMARIESVMTERYLNARGAERAVAGSALALHLIARADEGFGAGEFDAAEERLRRAAPIAAASAPGLRSRIVERLRRVRQRQAALERVGAMKRRLAEDPEDAAAAREMVRLWVVELDRPDEARKYSFLADRETAEMLRLAEVPPSAISAAQALRLGEWYAGFADAARDEAVRADMAERSIARYRLVIERSRPGEARHTQATRAVERLSPMAVRP